MTSWFRSWHGAPTDSKWPMIAKRVGVAPGIVAAIAWALMDYASASESRGSIEGFDIEEYSVFSGFEEQHISSTIKALEDKEIIKGNRFTSWEKRQPKREDSSADRTQRYREKNKSGDADKKPVTQCDAPEQSKNRAETEQIFAKNKSKNGFHSFAAFQGSVLNFTSDDYGELFKRYCYDGNEERFRGLLQKRDDWYSTQPYKTHKNWLNDTVAWLAKNSKPKADGWRKIQ